MSEFIYPSGPKGSSPPDRGRLEHRSRPGNRFPYRFSLSVKGSKKPVPYPENYHEELTFHRVYYLAIALLISGFSLKSRLMLSLTMLNY